MRQVIAATLLTFISAAAFQSCTKKDPPPTPDPTGNGTVKMEYSNVVGSAKLATDSTWYLNPNGDSFLVYRFSYFISNIKLNGTKGSYTETESYHLINQNSAASMSFDLKDVPYDTYSSVTFMIGVDSLRNVSGAQTGALDVNSGMFWDWNTGYIMLKLEGVSTKSPAFEGGLVFHAGGFSGPNATQRTVTLNFPSPVKVGKDGVTHVHVDADLNKMFQSPTLFDFSVLHSIHMPGANAKILADNYANMFTVSYAGL